MRSERYSGHHLSGSGALWDLLGAQEVSSESLWVLWGAPGGCFWSSWEPWGTCFGEDEKQLFRFRDHF